MLKNNVNSNSEKSVLLTRHCVSVDTRVVKVISILVYGNPI